jgi:phage major head subunit gpT-like protein
MAITPSNYAPFITTVDTTIGAVLLEMASTLVSREYTTEVPITGSIFSLGWTGKMPKARPWFGSRVIHFPAAQTYQVEPIPYELTYAIDRFVRDDSDVNTQSIFWRMLPDMAQQWVLQQEYESRDLLENAGIQTGSRQNGTDGLTAFNTSHPIDIYNPAFNGGGNALFASGTYCNDFTGGGQTINGTLIGGALSTTAFASVLQYMQVIPAEDGETLGLMPGLMVVPSTLQVEAMFILKSTLLASPTWGAFSPLAGQVGTADNQLAKMGVRLLVNPRLRNTKRWYLMDVSRSFKPLLWIKREAPRVIPRINEADPLMFDQHLEVYGGWDRVAPAWDYPFLMARSGP